MPSPADRLIAAALRDFQGNEETRLAAGHELAGQMRTAGTLSTERAEAMIARWEEVDAGKKRFLRPAALGGLLVLAALVMLALNLREVPNYRVFWGSILPDLSPPTRNEDWGAAEFAERERSGPRPLLLMGTSDDNLHGQSSRELWQSDPGNPAYFAEHVARTLAYSGVLPPDFLATADRIDPGNAWFRYIAASHLAVNAVDYNYTWQKMPNSPKHEWIIRDAAALDRVIALAEEAGRMPRYESYRKQMAATRIPWLHQGNRVDYHISLAGLRAPEFEFTELGFAFSAKAEELAAAGDKERFRGLVRVAEDFFRKRLSEDDPKLETADQIERSMDYRYGAFARTAEAMGLPEEAARLEGIDDRLNEPFYWLGGSISDGHNILSADITTWNTLAGLGGMSPAWRLRVPYHFLAPGNRSDHALAWRVLSFGMAGLFGLCMVLLWAQRFFVPQLVSATGRRVHLLLTRADYGWIFITGMVMPVCYIYLVSRFLPESGHERSLRESRHLVPLFQCASMFVMIAVSTMLACRWRLALRAAGLLPERASSWLDWAAFGMLAAYLPVVGWLGWWRWGSAGNMMVPVVLLVPPLAWLVAATLGTPFLGQGRQLEAAALRHALITASGCAGLWMLCLLPVFKIEEDYWFRKNELIRLEPEYGGTRYEYELAREKRAALREATGL